MEILELNMKHFGKFQEQRMEFHPGVNIIYGGNETGKSTIHAFIRAMFFGIERGRGKAGRRDEYQLRQPWDNPSYFAGTMRVRYGGRIYRIERNFNKNERDVHLICETTGEELSMKDGEFSGLLAGMSEAAFRNTVFISQAGCETDAGLAEELQKFMVNFQETGDGSLDVSRALDKLKAQKKQIESKKKQEQELLDEKIARKQMEMEYVKRELEIAMAKQNSAEALREEYEEEVERSEKQGSPYNKFLLWVNILLLLGGVLGFACGIFALNIWMRIGMFLLGGIFLVLFGMVLRYTIRVMKRGGNARKMREEAHSRNGKNQGSEGFEEERNRNQGLFGSREKRTEERQEERSENRTDRAAEKQLAGEKQLWEQEEQRRILQEKSVQLETIRQEMEELYGQREGLISYDQELEAIDLAMLRIKELSAKIYREAGTEFNRTASEILSELTEGRYSQLALDEKMEVRINTPSHLLYLYQVSYGTMNQVYFALRMAAGRLLSGGQPVPIILDEAFAMYDDERLEAALRWLDGCGRQVILFSCQTREKIILDHIRQEQRERS